MRHLKTYGIFENSTLPVTPEQSLWLNKVCIGSWTLKAPGVINVEGSVDIRDKSDHITPEGENFHGLKFGKVEGYFDCGKSPQMTHLGGTPREVTGSFYFKEGKLPNLVDGPVTVGSKYQVTESGLESLEGCPLRADVLDVEFNELKNLKGAEKSRIRVLMIGFNSINSLEGMPRELEDIKGTNNPVSGETLGKIISAMEANPDLGYGEILASLQSRISQEDWEKLGKSSLDKMNQIQKKVYGMLGGIGGI